MTVDYSFYQSVYGGTLPRVLFDAGLSRAEETILSLLYPRRMEDLDPAETKGLCMAVCAQLDAGLDRPVDSETAGDFQTRFAGSLVRIHGMPAAPGAVGYLRQAGVLRQWV
ncbi:MAG: hypothetical protein IJ480_00370 [Clostridia bacterium]|nr:hypothetical protein [Clostridia bacterium]